MLFRSGASIFSYTLSRPYPSHKYTWAVLVGGTILAVLFTFVAVANDGYVLKPTYETNPNATEKHTEWFQKDPFSWMGSADTTCQDALLTAGGMYFTTNRGFVYSLSRIQNSTGVLSSAAYKNSPLQACEVAKISISLSRLDNTRLPQNYWTWGASQASATVTCTLTTTASPPGQVQADFLIQLPTVHDRSQITTGFLTQNISDTHLHMIYGLRLTGDWYLNLGWAMGYSTPAELDPTASWDTGSIELTRNTKVGDYTDLKFFSCSAMFMSNKGDLAFLPDGVTIEDWENQWTVEHPWKLPNISMTIDAFGKSLYSLLLSDFGVGNKGNALQTAEGIRYLQGANDTILQAASYAANPNITGVGVVHDVLTSDATTVELNDTTDTMLFSQYLCSNPTRKHATSMLLAVVLADIVFLTTCLTLFNVIATWLLQRKDPQLYRCEGCLAANPRDPLELDDAVSSGPTQSRRSSEGPMYSHELLPIGDHERLSNRSADPLLRLDSNSML